MTHGNEDAVATGRALVGALARALDAQLIETHISWVLLAAGFAYKVKKPLRLPFVDYATLALRRHFCQEELRLNRRLAPSLYLGVSRITGTPAAPALDGEGPVLEYAVRMRRFPAGALLSERLASERLDKDDVDRVAILVARFQQGLPSSPPASGFGNGAARRSRALAALAGAAPAAIAGEQAFLAAWLEAGAAELLPLWSARCEHGAVREGHGDLHLDNLVILDGAVAAFDCIEFDPTLRWIDVLDEIAFPVMDFAARARADLAYRLLNLWLDLSGDHGALPALRFALVYRALVRAHTACLRGPQAAPQARRYLQAALRWTVPGEPRLTITHGLPGSGKTFASQRLLEQHGAIRLRSDVERKRLAGLAMLDDSRAAGLDLYGAGASAATYARLFELARAALRAGHPVILDAAFLRRDERARALALSRELRVPYAILACEAPPAVLRERIGSRRGDASEADLAVLERLRTQAEPLEQDELAWLLPCA
jgi:aminoglycoside phosphotransferase family enzyme/predicted kinase